MSLIINKISSSTLQVNYSYLESDLLFGYETVANYTVDFADITYTNEQNVLFEGIDALREAFQRKNLVARIGGDEFVNGRIKSQSFEESSLVGSSKCNLTIEESKRLNSYSNNEFAQHIPSPHWIESFQESFSFSRSADSYSSSRTVSLKYKQDAGDQFLNNAKLFLRNIYKNSRPNLGHHVDGISENGRFDGGFRPIITETIDLLGLSVSLQENLETSFIDNDHSKKQSYSLEVDENGYLQKKYTVDIKALKEPLEQVADDACKLITESLVASNSDQFGPPSEITKTINKDGGVINLGISFSNNPNSANETNAVYTTSRDRDGSFFSYSMSVTISSGGKNRKDKTAKAKAYRSIVSSSYPSKIFSLYSINGNIYETSRSYSFSSRDGAITDSITYSNNPAYDISGLPEGITKLQYNNTTSPLLDRARTFFDVISKSEVVEVAKNLKSAGSGSISMNVTAHKSKGISFIRSFLNGLGLPSSPNQVITGDSITISSNDASRVITYEYY